MKSLPALAFSVFFSCLAGCGGGGGSSSSSAPPVAQQPVSQPAAVTPAPARTLITLQSDAGDPIGLGKNYSYSNPEATISVIARAGLLSITVKGDQDWTADFQVGGDAPALKVGTYADLDAYIPSAGTAKAGMRWYGEGRGCASSKGWFAIDSVTYAGGSLQSISLRFERHCDGAVPAMRGSVLFTVDDKTAPPEVGPIPADLWRPPASVTAGNGNYVYLESSPGDYVGQGKTYLYDKVNSTITGNMGPNFVAVAVEGDEKWNGVFYAMQSMQTLKAGYYPQLRLYPFHNPTRGGMYWAVDGRGCLATDGWFAIDAVTIDSGMVTAIEARFEQHCEGRAAPLRGAIRRRLATASPPATIPTSPAGSWQAPPLTPVPSGNYLYIEGDPAGYQTARQRRLLDSKNSVFTVTANGPYLRVIAAADTWWFGDILLPNSTSQLKPGAYINLDRFLFEGQATAAMSWSGDFKSCVENRNWLVIDSVNYDGAQLSAIDLRFEMLCQGSPMHGVLHWRRDSDLAAPGPINTAPEMWRPPASAIPANGNYAYLASDRSDFIGAGAAYRYTPVDASIKVTSVAGALTVAIDGDEHWTMEMATMHGHPRLEPGYYPALTNTGPHNPARGGFSFSGEGRGCNVAESGVIIDNVAYTNGALTALEMRFEQHCEQGSGALRGAIRWSATDTAVPPGPVNPIPPTLWQAPSGSAPASGNYVFLQSDPGDFIGSIPASVARTPTLPVTVSATGNRLQIAVAGGPNGDLWTGQFTAMSSLTRIEPGFYDHLLRIVQLNPARGGFSWGGDGHGCNQSLSWFAVDKAVYTNGQLTALDARFEQHCEFMAPALRGSIHWAK